MVRGRSFQGGRPHDRTMKIVNIILLAFGLWLLIAVGIHALLDLVPHFL